MRNIFCNYLLIVTISFYSLTFPLCSKTCYNFLCDAWIYDCLALSSGYLLRPGILLWIEGFAVMPVTFSCCWSLKNTKFPNSTCQPIKNVVPYLKILNILELYHIYLNKKCTNWLYKRCCKSEMWLYNSIPVRWNSIHIFHEAFIKI